MHYASCTNKYNINRRLPDCSMLRDMAGNFSFSFISTKFIQINSLFMLMVTEIHALLVYFRNT